VAAAFEPSQRGESRWLVLLGGAWDGTERPARRASEELPDSTESRAGLRWCLLALLTSPGSVCHKTPLVPVSPH